MGLDHLWFQNLEHHLHQMHLFCVFSPCKHGHFIFCSVSLVEELGVNKLAYAIPGLLFNIYRKWHLNKKKHKLQNWFVVQFVVSEDSLVKCLVIEITRFKKNRLFFWSVCQRVLVKIGKFNFTLILLVRFCAW